MRHLALLKILMPDQLNYFDNAIDTFAEQKTLRKEC